MYCVNVRNCNLMLCIFLILICSIIMSVHGFTTPTFTVKNKVGGNKRNHSLIGMRSSNGKKTILHMAEGTGSSKKKRRKRKKERSSESNQGMEMPIIPEDDIKAIKEMSQSGGDKPSLDDLRALADFQAKGSSSSSNFMDPQAGGDELLVELPDIRDALKNKEMKKTQELEAQKQQRKKISRKDTKAFLEVGPIRIIIVFYCTFIFLSHLQTLLIVSLSKKLLEAEPFADADDSYFEDEEYGTVSALLAEGAKPFLGIPPGPLQVGHFIGSLVIILCAFIDYPGFPLTNLPTPLREGLQGGKICTFCISVDYNVNTFFMLQL